MKWEKENPEIARESKKKVDSKEARKNKKKLHARKRREQGLFVEWQRNNPNRLREYAERRKQNKEHSITKEEWELCKKYFNSECAYCGLHISEHFNLYAGELKWTDFHKEHVDHEGSNKIDNCVPSCKKCNSEKHTYDFYEWFIEGRKGYSDNKKDRILKWLNSDWKELQ